MVELKYDNITLAAVHTRMTTKVFNHELGIQLGQSHMSFVSLLEVGWKIRVIMRSRVHLVTVFAYAMAGANCSILECKILYWLGWWPAFGADLHLFHEATITPGGRLFNGPHFRLWPRVNVAHLAVEAGILPGGRVFAWLQMGEDRRLGQSGVNRHLDLLAEIVTLLHRPVARNEHVH